MKRILRVSLILLLVLSVLSLSACDLIRFGAKDNEDEIASSDKEQDIQQEDDEENKPVQTPSEPQNSDEGNATATPMPSPKKPADRNIVEVGWENTIGPATSLGELDKYALNKRLLGLIDNSLPHGVEDHVNGIVMTGKGYILNERFKEEIFKGISIGSDFNAIRAILGNPGWETDSILLYRNWNYYILFQGNGSAQYAVLTAAPDTLYDKYILSSIISELNSDDYLSLEESLGKMDPDGTFFDSTGFINGGGYYAHSRYGIMAIDFDEKYIEVYNNYQGNLFDDSSGSPRYEVRFIDRDMTIDTMLADLNSYLEIEELFKSEAVTSPDGKLSAVYEWIYSMDQHFIVRTLDHSIQDRYIYAATASKFYWLTNSHLVFIDAYNELPYAIDVNFSDPSAINILYEAGVIKERDTEPGKYKYEILSVQNGVLSLKDIINNKTLNIKVSEDSHGQILVKADS